MNFESYDEFRTKRTEHRQQQRLQVPYRGNNDVFTDHRHAFVRRLQRAGSVQGPYNEDGREPMRPERVVFWSCVTAAVVAALLIYYGVIR